MNTENTALEHELGWDDTITKDSNEFILLPEGEYNFTVESFDSCLLYTSPSPRDS